MRLIWAAFFSIILFSLAVGALAQGDRHVVSIPVGDDILASCSVGLIYSTPSGGSLIVGCAVASPTATPTRTPSPTPTPGPSSTPTITPTPDALWFLAGGVDPVDVVGAWRAKGAASYAGSLINLVDGPDLYAPAGSPTWTPGKGWQGGQNNRLQVVGGVYPAYGWSYFMKVRNALSYSQQFMGCRNIYGNRATGMDLNNTGAYQEVSSFNGGSYGGVVLTGTMSIGGQVYYRNGAPAAPTMAAGTGACTVPLMILTGNWGGSPHGGSFQTEVQGVAIYSDTLTAGQAAAIATAVGGW